MSVEQNISISSNNIQDLISNVDDIILRISHLLKKSLRETLRETLLKKILYPKPKNNLSLNLALVGLKYQLDMLLDETIDPKLFQAVKKILVFKYFETFNKDQAILFRNNWLRRESFISIRDDLHTRDIDYCNAFCLTLGELTHLIYIEFSVFSNKNLRFEKKFNSDILKEKWHVITLALLALPELQTLDFFDNSFNYADLPYIRNLLKVLKYLKNLHITCPIGMKYWPINEVNKLFKTIICLNNLQKLVLINIINSEFSPEQCEIIIANINNLTQLKCLGIITNNNFMNLNISNLLTQSVGQLEQLIELYLCGGIFNINGWTLAKLNKLEVLNLTNNSLGTFNLISWQIFCNVLINCKNLREINLSFNYLGINFNLSNADTTINQWQVLCSIFSTLPNLKELDLRNNHLHHLAPNEWEYFLDMLRESYITCLYIEGNNLSQSQQNDINKIIRQNKSKENNNTCKEIIVRENYKFSFWTSNPSISNSEPPARDLHQNIAMDNMNDQSALDSKANIYSAITKL